MKEYFENTMHQHIDIVEYTETEKLPLIYKSNYKLYLAEIGKVQFLMAEPVQKMNLSALRKQHKQLEKLTELRCVLYLTKLNYYAKEMMLLEGIPFILEGKQIYLPFLGMALSNYDKRALKTCEQISFLTQKLLLTAIYEGWKDINVTEAAKKLKVAKTSITRCYNELEILEIPYLKTKSRSRLFCGIEDKKEMWLTLKPYLRNPLIKQYELKQDIEKDLRLSDISALCNYSMLSDNEYRTYAVTKSALKELQLSYNDRVQALEVPGCIVQELGYMVDFGNNEAIDPFSVWMLISDTEKTDPRVEKSLNEMMEEYVW
ncbi:MAG: hypothetical protein JJE03_01075 [Peptostreptococcaceae bacterium]|nr:hypothetical protein [Peptostreptococcaceae bacterium]